MSTQKRPAAFVCPLCPRRFTRAFNLRGHLRTHTDERPFVCSVCGKAFSREHDRKSHEALHSGEKKFKCKGGLAAGGSWGCGQRFARASALGRHFRSQAGRVCIKPLLDEEARKRTRAPQEPQATTHQSPSSRASSNLPRIEANFMGDFACCGLGFPSLQDLRQHYENIHAWKLNQAGQASSAQQPPVPDSRGAEATTTAPNLQQEAHFQISGSLSERKAAGGMIPAALLAQYPALAEIDWSEPPRRDELRADVSRSESADRLSHEYYSSRSMPREETGIVLTTSNQTPRYVEALEARLDAAESLLEAIFRPERLPGSDTDGIDEQHLDKLIDSWRPDCSTVNTSAIKALTKRHILSTATYLDTSSPLQPSFSY